MSLDLFIFSSFLVLSLILGIISSTKVHNISEYALGNRDFSTATIIATLIATYIGAGIFSFTLIETYRQGIYFLIPSIGLALTLVVIGHFLVPRMGEFLGKLSIAESMGDIFGPRVRIMTVIFCIIGSICYLSIQFKVSAKVMELIFGTSGGYATLMSAFIVIAYSTLGGIRAVTFTDIIQFFTFWKLFFSQSTIDSVIPGILSSIIFLFGSHYLTNQKGGWIGIKDQRTYTAVMNSRKRFWYNIWYGIKSFNFINFCKSYTPKKIETFFFLGLFAIISTIITMISMRSSELFYNNVVASCYISVFTFASYLLIYPLWPSTFKKHIFVAIFWVTATFYINIFMNGVFFAISNGSQIQTAIFFLNVTAILILYCWKAALFMLLIGFISSFWFVKTFLNLDYLNILDVQFYLIFFLLLISSILIAFLKPHQEANDQNKELLSVQSKELCHMSEQLLKHMIIRQEFINNVNHEMRTPIHHVGAYLNDLEENFDTSSNEEKRESIKALQEGYDRIRGYMDNILDLSSLSNNNVKLKYENVNFQELVNEIIEQFTNLYLDDKDIQFYSKCNTKDLNVKCDKDKITQVLINLFKNAVEFTPKGTIEIVLSKETIGNTKAIECAVIDEGVGIPEEELFDIFGPFIQSSRTKNISGGKGLGLAICEHIIKLHKGKIYAKNNSKKGAIMAFTIPL